MALVLSATVGGTTSNSYITVADADSYAAGKVGLASFKAADVNVKEAALVEATDLIDRHGKWKGYIANPSIQSLRWPRFSVMDRDDWYVPSNVIPLEIAHVVVDLADWLIKSNGFNVDTNTVDQVTVGGTSKGITVKFNTNLANIGFPKDIMTSLGFWGRVTLTTSSANSVDLVRA